MRRLLILTAVVGSAIAGYRLILEPWWRRWGVDPGEATRALPGDDILPEGVAETRGITIEAQPAAIWAWLVQMGYGRAGWYSYDQIDMAGASAHEIVPELQHLAVGDVIPTHPGGGFLVKVVEPDQALVLYSDTELVRQQAEAAKESGTADAAANIRATGALMEGAQPAEFAATWAFVLEPVDEGETRLIERFRVRFGDSDKPWTRFTLPLMGFGVFVMMRRQLLGIRGRVEANRGSRERRVADTTAGNGASLESTPAPSALAADR